MSENKKTKQMKRDLIRFIEESVTDDTDAYAFVIGNVVSVGGDGEAEVEVDIHFKNGFTPETIPREWMFHHLVDSIKKQDEKEGQSK